MPFNLSDYVFNTLVRNGNSSRVSDELVNWARDRFNLQIERTASGDVISSDDAFRCECCQDVYHVDDSTTVTVSRRRVENQEAWCDDCADSDSFVCDWNGERYSNNDFAQVECEGDYICLEANQDDVYYWESDGEYHTSPEAEDSEDDDCDGDSVEHGVIAGYHAIRRRYDIDPSAELYGPELETLSPSVESLRKCAEAAHDAGFIAERDGSLDGSRGVEYVGPPATLASFQDANGAWPMFLSKLRRIGCKSWEAGKGYGMHVNINRGALTQLHGAKVVAFVNENDTLGEMVAGREAIHWATYRTDRKRSRLIQKIHTGLGKVQPVLVETDKYEAAAVRGKRIEVRIFRGTLKTESFVRNIEYCAAVVAFTRNTLMSELNESRFYDFVSHRRKQFPALAAFLTAKGKVAPTKVKGEVGQQKLLIADADAPAR